MIKRSASAYWYLIRERYHNGTLNSVILAVIQVLIVWDVWSKIIDINLLVTHALFGLEYRQTSLTLICLSLMPSGCVEYRQISLTLISRTGSYSSSYTCSQKLAMIKIIITKALYSNMTLVTRVHRLSTVMSCVTRVHRLSTVIWH